MAIAATALAVLLAAVSVEAAPPPSSTASPPAAAAPSASPLSARRRKQLLSEQVTAEGLTMLAGTVVMLFAPLVFIFCRSVLRDPALPQFLRMVWAAAAAEGRRGAPAGDLLATAKRQ